jgi:hypothetical protein
VSIRTAAHRDDIGRLLDEIGLLGCHVEIVPSVHEWAASVAGVREKNPDRLAMALRTNGEPLIVLKADITDDDQAGVVGGMVMGGFDEELKRIEPLEAFLEHLVLHEAAHLILPPGASEHDCDQWAFDHLDSRFRGRTA